MVASKTEPYMREKTESSNQEKDHLHESKNIFEYNI